MRGRARRGVLQDIGAKLAQPPSAATLAALTGGAAAPCSPHDRGRVRAAHTDASEGSARPRVVAIDAIRPSPYQPVGRPPSAAVDAVSAAVALSGSLAALVDDATSLAALPRDARDLAALAADVAARGVEVPLDVRHVATGTEHGGDGARFELLSGHRRLAAARLAGLAHVPVQDRGELDDHDAALAVFRANTHRVDFAPWHEAVSLAALRRQRLAASVSGSVRELAKLMGFSVGRAAELLQIADAFPGTVLAAVGDGDPTRAEDALARLEYTTLRRLIHHKDAAQRIAAAKRALHLDVDAARATRGAPAPGAIIERRDRRDGSRVITVRKPAASMTPLEAAEVLRVLELEVAAVRPRAMRDGSHQPAHANTDRLIGAQ